MKKELCKRVERVLGMRRVREEGEVERREENVRVLRIVGPVWASAAVAARGVMMDAVREEVIVLSGEEAIDLGCEGLADGVA